MDGEFATPPGTEGGSHVWPRGHGRRRWRVLLAVGLAATAVGAGAAGGGTAQAAPGTDSVIGTVVCSNGKAVVGVWMESRAGGSSFLDWTTLPGWPNAATIYGKVPEVSGGSQVQLRVGCGGRPEHWANTSVSPWYQVPRYSVNPLNVGTPQYLNAVCDGHGSCTWPARGIVGKDSPNPFVGGPPAGGVWCTVAASQWWRENTGTYPAWHNGYPIAGLSGDALNWGTEAQALGWTVTDVPTPGSVFVMQPGGGTSSSGGHVGVVLTVNVNAGRTVLFVWDANWQNDGRTQTHSIVSPPRSMRYIVTP